MINTKCENVLDSDYEVVEEKESVKIIKNKMSGIFECLKVINISKLNEDIVKSVFSKIERVNNEKRENLIKYHKLMLIKDKFYRLMPYIRINLEEINPLKYFEEIGTYAVLCGICNGIKSLHMLNISHGDLKPSNIFLDKENEVILSDYLNNELFKGNENKRKDERGNICFISYDEIIGDEVSKESDIWSFGCIFYYVISGKLIFKDKTPLETMLNIRECKYEKLECEFEKELNGLLSKMMLKEKNNRISIDEILNELKRIDEVKYLPEVVEMKEKEEEIKGLDEGIKERIDNALNEMINEKSTKLDLNCGFFDRIPIREVGALYLSRKLKLYPFITIINLRSNKMGDEGFNHICQSFKYLPELKELYIDGNNITSNGMKYFVENIQFIPKLEKLNLEGNRNIRKKGMEILSKSLHLLPNMKWMSFYGCYIGDDGFKIFFSHLKDIPNLEYINVGFNYLTDKSIKVFCDNIQYITKLEKLNLGFNKIGKEGMEMLSKSLHLLPNMKWMSFYNCEIGDDGFKIFFSHLKDIPNLEYLNVRYNNLTDESIKVFCDNIQYITKLKSMDLSFNRLSDEEGRLLSQYLPKCLKLGYLNINFNKFTNNENIKRIIKENHPNKELKFEI